MVLDKWSISVDSGEVVVLKGDNGCGKSTVIEAAAGLIPLENGHSKISDQLMYKLKIFNSVNLNNGIYSTLEEINRNKKFL